MDKVLLTQDDVRELFSWLRDNKDLVRTMPAPLKAMEDKQKICDLLAETLRATRGASDLVSLIYNAEKETVEVLFAGGGKRIINVAMDSGTSMIRDIVNHLGC